MLEIERAKNVRNKKAKNKVFNRLADISYSYLPRGYFGKIQIEISNEVFAHATRTYLSEKHFRIVNELFVQRICI
jgi:hypothetical protein